MTLNEDSINYELILGLHVWQGYGKMLNRKLPSQFNFLITGKSKGFWKEQIRKMSYIRIIFITVIITCCIKCFVSFRIDIQKLFNKTVDCFLLKELQNPKTEIDYFTSSKNTLPVVVQRLTEMSHVVLILFSIAVSHEWKNMLFL